MITPEDITSAVIKRLNSDQDLTDLLPNGRGDIGTGLIPIRSSYPYILVETLGTVERKGMGLCPHYTTARVNISVFCDEKPEKPPEGVVNTVHKACHSALMKGVSFSGGSVETPEFVTIHEPGYKIESDNIVVYWSTQWWNIFATEN